MNRRALWLVITGLIAAVAAGLVVFFIANGAGPKPPPPTPVAGGPTATALPSRIIVVAATDIPANAEVNASMVTTSSFPLSVAPSDAFTSVADVVSRTALSTIYSDQPLLARQFTEPNKGRIISTLVTPGKVLVAFPSTDMLNATGVIQKGDHVDIMLTIPISGTTRLDSGAETGSQQPAGQRAIVTQGTIQNVVVYSVGQWTPPGAATANGNAAAANTSLKVITFEVDHQEALILKYVKDSGGTIDLAVRSDKEDKIVKTDPVTLDYLVDLYGFIGINTPPKPTP